MSEIPASEGEREREREKERATERARELSSERRRRRRRRGEIILQQIDLLLKIVRRFSKQSCEKTSKNIAEKSENLGSGLGTSRRFKHGGNCSCFPRSFRKYHFETGLFSAEVGELLLRVLLVKESSSASAPPTGFQGRKKDPPHGCCFFFFFFFNGARFCCSSCSGFFPDSSAELEKPKHQEV